MTGYEVHAEALLEHSKGSQASAENFASLASLLEQARVSDDCFGPIGEFMAFAYFNGLEECQALANDAKGFLEEIAEKTTQAAKMYQQSDEAVGDGMKQIDSALSQVSTGPGSLADLNSAGGDKQRSFVEQHGGYGSSWLKTGHSLSTATSPPDIAIATVHTRLEQLQLVTSPGQAFIDNGLGFLIGIVISPFVEFILEPAIGDPDQMRSTAMGWEKVAEWLDTAGEDEKKRAEATAEAWQGPAGDAFRTQLNEFGDGSAAFADNIRDLKQILETAADLFDMFVEIVIDILTELVLGLIIEWLAALAASWITAGASVAAAGAATTAQVGITGTRLGLKVKDLVGKLGPLVRRLEDILVTLRNGPLRGLMQQSQRLQGMPGGDFLHRQLGSQSPLYRIVTNADNAGRSVTGNHFMGSRGLSNTGSDALAANLSELGLRAMGMNGTTRVGTAALHGTMENAPTTAVEQGVKHGYHETTTSDEQQRQEDIDRGFSL